ncbi:MAG: hypothetical protein M3Q10_13890 [Chloroflexota bacterium]|nr:hypothetical protein [Chloroflexota bacterium]
MRGLSQVGRQLHPGRVVKRRWLPTLPRRDAPHGAKRQAEPGAAEPAQRLAPAEAGPGRAVEAALLDLHLGELLSKRG